MKTGWMGWVHFVAMFFWINLGLKFVRLRMFYWPMNCSYHGYSAYTTIQTAVSLQRIDIHICSPWA
jgi:hypothetical protein